MPREIRPLLADSLSISRRQSPACRRLEEHIDAACRRWPELVSALEDHGRHESYRRWLRVVRWRLERPAEVTPPAPRPAVDREVIDELWHASGARTRGGSLSQAQRQQLLAAPLGAAPTIKPAVV